MDDLAALSQCIAGWGLTYKHHVCAEELGNYQTAELHGVWAADTSGAGGEIEEGRRRFLVRLR